MAKSTPVSEIMTTGVQTVDVRESLGHVRRTLRDGAFHHVPIVDGGKLVGLLSSRDLLRVYRGAKETGPQPLDEILDASGSIADAMSTNLVKLQADESVERAIDLLADGHIHSVLIVDARGRLAGIVTDHDLLDYLGA